MGLVSAGPDEYKVQKNKSLEIPPHYYLPEPMNPASPEPEEKFLEKDGLGKEEESLLKELN